MSEPTQGQMTLYGKHCHIPLLTTHLISAVALATVSYKQARHFFTAEEMRSRAISSTVEYTLIQALSLDISAKGETPETGVF